MPELSASDAAYSLRDKERRIYFNMLLTAALLKVQTPDREGIKSGPAATSYFKRTRITQTSVRGTRARTRTRTRAHEPVLQCLLTLL